MTGQIDSIIAQKSRKNIKFFALKALLGERFNFDLTFEWGVVAFASGIALYFALPFEPDLRVSIALEMCFVAVLFRWRKAPNLKPLVIVIFLLMLGLVRATWHTQAADSPKLPEFERAYSVEGWIKSIEASGSRKRWEIAVKNIERFEAEDTPHIIRTTATGEGIKAGDPIRIRAVLSGPPGPAVPGGYDPARRAYFEKIGGYGFSISKPEIIEMPALTGRESLLRSVIKFRYGLADRIRESAPPETAGLQASLLTGIRTYIKPEQTEALRVAGLAHILAISGLHMGLVAFGIYSLTTFLLACILPLSRRYDVRKGAAIFGAMAATFYLIISGGSVATQRAYVMVMIVFLAVILDRRAFSMRSVALAAVITLLWHPEALLGAGFQMSFSAVAALVVVYRFWDQHREYRPDFLSKITNAINSLAVTSFIAGLATSAFAVLQFNRMASYGLAGNLLAMPIFTFWVMPAAIAVFPALLIGQEAFPLWVMGEGLSYVLSISQAVSAWPGAIAYVKAAPSWVIGFYSLSFAAICLGPKAIRVIGVTGVILSGCIWWVNPTADLRVSRDGVVAYWAPTERDVLYVKTKRADRYGQEQFSRRSGEAQPEKIPYKQEGAACDGRACRTSIKGRIISIVDYPSEVSVACQNADIVILTQRRSGPVSKRNCEAILIDQDSLQKHGAVNIYINKETIRVEEALKPSRKRRPWG